MKKVKIYGTVGPACEDRDILRDMFREGMDGVRLNLSHTTLEDAAGLIESCQWAARECMVRPELLIDMQGPELRIGEMKQPLWLGEGDLVCIDDVALPDVVARTLRDCCLGQEVLLDDGRILLRTELAAVGGVLGLRVVRGGMLLSRKSVALPGRGIHSPAMTEKDLRQIEVAKEFGVTAVMQPFVRSREDLIDVRRALDMAGGSDILLFAKIENMDGVDRLDELIGCCDEIVIARGDLGNSMDLWELPAVQKDISAKCRAAGRDFMVVTQMLDSMINRQVPTRAEVSDIFNAVLDGAASVMVTGETAAGKYPVQAIRYLVRTVREAEAYAKMV